MTTFAQDMEIRNIEREIRTTERALRSCEVRIDDHKSSILTMRKRAAVLRTTLRRQQRQLAKKKGTA